MTAIINNGVYDELAHTWWDENEFLHLLKAMVNPWRVLKPGGLFFFDTINRAT